jgi:hypothetical protein
MSQRDLELERVAFYGRTLSEYLLFFNLSLDDLKKYDRIIDCPSGASSFISEVNGLFNGPNKRLVVCDPLFDKNLEYLKQKGMDDVSYVIEKVQSAFLHYNWNFYKTIENLKAQRTLALTKFLSDYIQGQKEKRYLKASLPCLPFEDGSFDLVLSGHFLFTYANKFDFEFHKKSVLDLYRISSGEVRIYPIQQRSSQTYSELNKLLSLLKEHNITYRILKVPFEFQKGSNKMLCLLHTS